VLAKVQQRKSYLLLAGLLLLFIATMVSIAWHPERQLSVQTILYPRDEDIDLTSYAHEKIIIFQAGIALIIAYFFTREPLPNLFSRSNQHLILSAIICVSFYIRSLWGYTLPFFYGYDTAHYIASSFFLAQNYEEIVPILILHTKYLPFEHWGGVVPCEPFPFLLFASIIKVGLPAASIPRIVIPFFSSITLLPFFLLVKHFYGVRVGFIATLFLGFAPLQFRFMADLYRNVIGNFFLFLSLYYILSERKMISPKSLTSTLLLFLSHIQGALILITTTLIWSFLKRDKMLFRKALLVITISSLASLSPIWAVDAGRMLYARMPVSLRPEESLGVLFSQLRWLSPFFIPSLLFAVPSLVRIKRRDFVVSLLGCLVIFFLFAIVFVITTFPPERAIFYLEFPLVMSAAGAIGKAKNYQYLAFLVSSWEFLQSMWMVKLPFLYGPSKPWHFYASYVTGMPSVVLEPSPGDWLLSNLLFTVFLVAFIGSVMNYFSNRKIQR